MADPPTGISLPMLSPATGDAVVAKPAGLKGVRVYATTNMESFLFEEAPDPFRWPGTFPRAEGPWTWPVPGLEGLITGPRTGLRGEGWPPKLPGREVPPDWRPGFDPVADPLGRKKEG